MAVDTGHYPYKYDEAVAAGVPVDVANVLRDYVDAQQAALDDPTSDNVAALNVLSDDVVKISVKHGSTNGLSVVSMNGSVS